MGTSDEDGFDGFFGALSTAFPWIFGIMLALILCGWVLTAVTIARNRRVLRQSGIDPSTVGSQLAVRLLRGQPTAQPVASASDRLVELTELRDRGLISPEEYQARREQIIGGI